MTESRSLPRVVALVPAWRAAAFIHETLESLAAQTYPNLQILISDDASPDNTAELCEAFAAQRENTRVIRQPKNLGWVGNINILIREARGDYFFFAFHDDVVRPTYVERLVEALKENPQAVVSFSDMDTHHLDGSVETQKYTLLEGTKSAYWRARHIISEESYWWAPNRGLFRAAAAREISGMKKHLAGEMSADWLWLLRLALIGEFVRVPELLVIKRFTKQSVSKTWKDNPWTRFALMLGCLRALHGARLPPTEELRLQLYALRALGRELNRIGRRSGRHIGRRLLSSIAGEGYVATLKKRGW
jgi:glycosyltransferase involved in cell wall biosynthesis